MTPAQVAKTMAALGGSRAVAPAAALPATPATLAPSPAATLPAPDVSATVPTPAASGLTRSVLHPAAQVQQQAGAVPWEQIVAECGLGPTGSKPDAPRSSATGIDAHGCGAIIVELGLNRSGARADAAQPSSTGTPAEATDWGEIVAEAGLGREAQPAAKSFTDDGWAALAAEAAAERRTKHQD